MRESGVEFLGEIPAHWETRPAVTLARVLTSTVDKKAYDGETRVRLCNYTDVYYGSEILDSESFMTATATADQIRRFGVRAGDVPFTKDSETADDIGIPAYVPHDMPGVVYGYHLSIYRPHDPRYGRFLRYLLESEYAKTHFAAKTPGVTRVGLSQATIRYFRVPAPPPDEASAIADFLDRETTRIDAFIAKNEELITLLTERRAAAFNARFQHHAGVETLTIRRVLKLAQTGPFGTQLSAAEYVSGGIPVINPSHILAGRIAPDLDVAVTPARAKGLARFQLEVGDVVLGRKGEVDKSAIVEPEFHGAICGSDSMLLRPGARVTSEYLWAFLQSPVAHTQLERFSVGSTVAGLNQQTLRSVRLPVPSVGVQQRLVEDLKRHTSRVDSALATARRNIGLARERRAALISAAVTGKIDVGVGA